MGAVAEAPAAVAGDPGEFCHVPAAPEELWAAHPTTVWAAADLVAAARLYAACRALEGASRKAAVASSQPETPLPPPSAGEQVPAAANEGPDAVPWPEAQALLEQVVSQEGPDLAGALWMAAVRELTRGRGSPVPRARRGAGRRAGRSCLRAAGGAVVDGVLGRGCVGMVSPSAGALKA